MAFPGQVRFRQLCLAPQTNDGVWNAATLQMPIVAGRIWQTPARTFYDPDMRFGDREPSHGSQAEGTVYPFQFTMPITPRHAPLVFHSLMGWTGAPATVDTTGKAWSYQTSNLSTFLRLAAEYNDGSRWWKAWDGCVNTVRMQGTRPGGVQLTASGFFLGRDKLTAPTGPVFVKDTPLVMRRAIYAIDPVGTAYGTTLVDNFFQEFDLTVTNGAGYDWARNDYVNPSLIVYGGFGWGLTIAGVEPSANYEWDNWNNQVVQNTQISIPSLLITTASQGMVINTTGKWDNREEVERVNGLANGLRFTVRAEKDETLGKAGQIVFTNPFAGPYV